MDRVNALEARTALYALLSRLYTYPLDAGALGLVAGLCLDATPDEAGAALAEMQRAMAPAGDLSRLVETLNCEATRLFEGPGQPAAPPFGSYYLDSGRLMGPEALAVRGAYLGARLLPERDGQFPPDRLSLELGFLAALAQTAVLEESLGALAASREFLTRHLLSWIPAWRADLLAAEPHPFFSALAGFTQAALEADLAWLHEDARFPGFEARNAVEGTR